MTDFAQSFRSVSELVEQTRTTTLLHVRKIETYQAGWFVDASAEITNAATMAYQHARTWIASIDSLFALGCHLIGEAKNTVFLPFIATGGWSHIIGRLVQIQREREWALTVAIHARKLMQI